MYFCGYIYNVLFINSAAQTGRILA